MAIETRMTYSASSPSPLSGTHGTASFKRGCLTEVRDISGRWRKPGWSRLTLETARFLTEQKSKSCYITNQTCIAAWLTWALYQQGDHFPSLLWTGITGTSVQPALESNPAPRYALAPRTGWTPRLEQAARTRCSADRSYSGVADA